MQSTAKIDKLEKGMEDIKAKVVDLTAAWHSKNDELKSSKIKLSDIREKLAVAKAEKIKG